MMINSVFLFRAFVSMVLLLLVVGCGTRVSDEIAPRINYQFEDYYFSSLGPAFSPLSNEERCSDWGTELTIGHAFAKERDLYRALFSYKRAEILVPEVASSRKLEIQYDILLCYYLGKRYEEALESAEKSGLERVDQSFPAYHDLLLILQECYNEVGDVARRDLIHEMIQKSFPDTNEQLKVSLALRSADLVAVSTINEDLLHPSYLDPVLDEYFLNKKSVPRAQLLNALIPGAGYLYLGQRKSAVTAFFLNSLFIGATYHFFHHRNFAAGLIAASFEAGWYFGGIYGAGEEAKYYNERLYEDAVTPTLYSHNLFPVLMLRHAF